MLIAAHSKLLMIGDSITDCGRDRTVEEATGDGLGNGYVSLIHSLLNATYPQAFIRVVNKGISGNTVRDLKQRWARDVLAAKPDWLSVMIGINDVWRFFDSNLPTNQQVFLPEFKSTLDKLIRDTWPGLKGLVLMTPYFIEPNRSEPMRKMMDEYGEAVRCVAGKYHALLVDTQAVMDAALVSLHPMALALDRVHPNPTGHALLARSFLNAIEYDWSENRAPQMAI